jgi:hypothetical protein
VRWRNRGLPSGKMADQELMPRLLPYLFRRLDQPLPTSCAIYRDPLQIVKTVPLMLLVPRHLWLRHIRRAKAEWWYGILPQWNSLGPDRVVLSAKHDGIPGSRTWALWSIEAGRTKATPYWGALHGWLWPQLPDVPRDISKEKSIATNRYLTIHSRLALREGWAILGPHGLGRDNCLLHYATGNELTRVWYLAIDEVDGCGNGVDRLSIQAGQRTYVRRAKPDELVTYPIVGHQARLRLVAEIEQQRMIKHQQAQRRWT